MLAARRLAASGLVLLRPARLGLVLRHIEMHMPVDVMDPADRDHVVLESADEVEPGQFDPVADDVIDATDVLAVGADDFEVFADLSRVYVGGSCRVRLARKTA